jgi:hypothetical protein
MKKARASVGSALDSRSAAQTADAIVVAEIVEPGQLDPGPPGHALHSSGRIRIVKNLRGKLAGVKTIEFLSQRFPETAAERIPVAGERHILFLRKLPSGSFQAIKMLPSTKQNMEETRSLGDNR